MASIPSSKMTAPTAMNGVNMIHDENAPPSSSLMSTTDLPSVDVIDVDGMASSRWRKTYGPDIRITYGLTGDAASVR